MLMEGDCFAHYCSICRSGKTHFCNLYPNALDFVVMPFKYKNYAHVATCCAEGESIKAHPILELRCDWRDLYYKALTDTYRRYPGEILVIPTDRNIMSRLERDSIPYTVVYPNRSLKEEYYTRYLARGNTESFLEVFIDGWDMWMDSVRNNNGSHIELQSGEFLSDVIKLPNRDFGIIENKETYITQIISTQHIDGNSLDAI